MGTKLIEAIRLSPYNKNRLDNVKGSRTYDFQIGRMLDYFEKTGYSPDYAVKNPNEKIEKRIEDLIKIFKVYERDTAKPMFEKIMDGHGSSDNKEQLIRLANENQDLMKQLRELQTKKDDVESAEMVRKKLNELASLVISQCDPSRFSTSAFGSELKVPKSFFEQLIKKIQNEYVL